MDIDSQSCLSLAKWCSINRHIPTVFSILSCHYQLPPLPPLLQSIQTCMIVFVLECWLSINIWAWVPVVLTGWSFGLSQIYKQTSSKETHSFPLALMENPNLISIHHDSNDQQVDHSFIFISWLYIIPLMYFCSFFFFSECRNSQQFVQGMRHLQLQGKKRKVLLYQLCLISCLHYSFSTIGFYSLLPDRTGKKWWRIFSQAFCGWFGYQEPALHSTVKQ